MNTIQHEIIINNFYGIIYKGLYLFFIYSYESIFYHKIFHIIKIQNKTNEIDKKIEELYNKNRESGKKEENEKNEEDIKPEKEELKEESQK